MDKSSETVVNRGIDDELTPLKSSIHVVIRVIWVVCNVLSLDAL